MSRIRIAGGLWRGRPLEAPEGADTTRPTTARTRESVASMVLSAFDLDLEGVRVLDAFAGSGALGLEFLSRGASWCTFCERDARAAALVRKNAQGLGADPKAWRVLRADVFALARRAPLAGSPFSLVLLDPPYATPAGEVSELVADLAGQGSLAPRALVLYERASDAPTLEAEGARLLRSKAHGTTATDLFETGAADER